MSDSTHILVAYKKSRYEQYAIDDDASGLEHLVEREDITMDAFMEAHETHKRSLEGVCDILDRAGLEYDAVFRGDVDDPSVYDLVIPVGGDGTVLDLSHRIETTPVLAVNSDPSSSIGYFCAGEVGRLPGILEDALEGRRRPYKLKRFYVVIEGERLDTPILNDILIGHSNPAAVSRYVLHVGDGDGEEQRSSGIWVSTPAGSTAAIRSAGGFVLPLESPCLEYLVREPYPVPASSYRYNSGIQPMDRRFELTSKMPDGRVYIDGPHLSHSFGLGDVVSIDHGAPPLHIFGLDERRRSF